MKKIIILVFFVFTSFSFAQEAYDKMANELSSSTEGIKKIAIIPFSYADDKSSTKDGSIIAERLTMKLINLHKFEIIERSVLDKVLNELKLQNSGAIDASSAKELGKVLGVDAIITGTLVPTADGKIEVNARVIKTETAQAIGAVQVSVDKDWLGGDNQQVQNNIPVQNQTNQVQKVSTPYVRGKHEYGFFDILMGFGSQKIDLKDNGGNTLNKMTASGAGPIGIRVGGYGKGIVGGDFEISVSKHKTDAQIAYINDVTPYSVKDGYIDATSFGLSGDLLLRTLTKVQFYFGLGLGLSVNNIKSTVILDKYNKLLNETSVGFILRVPLGIRFNIDNTTFFTEYRAEINATTFNRGNLSETNNLDFYGGMFVFGLGTKF